MMNCMKFLSIHFFQPDKVLKSIATLCISTAPTRFSIIHKLAEDALLSIVQVVNNNMEQYQPQY